jgi:hypothetical protein
MVKKKKKTTRKKTTRRRVAPKRKSVPKRKIEKVEKGPEYMIQISDPKMLRKDLLESLREVIIFMQGYEKFRKIQEEKVNLFNGLKTSVRELNSLIDVKLRSYMPRGKLKAMADVRKPQGIIDSERVEVVNVNERQEMPEVDYDDDMEMPVSKPKNDLAELEDQLNDIEAALKKIS